MAKKARGGLGMACTAADECDEDATHLIGDGHGIAGGPACKEHHRQWKIRTFVGQGEPGDDDHVVPDVHRIGEYLEAAAAWEG